MQFLMASLSEAIIKFLLLGLDIHIVLSQLTTHRVAYNVKGTRASVSNDAMMGTRGNGQISSQRFR